MTSKHIFLTIFTFVGSILFGQKEELSQKIEAFAADHQEKFEKKELNIADREIGSLEETGYSWKEEFMLKSHEKTRDNLDRNTYQKFYFSFYGYDSHTDRQYALKDWMENFIEGKSIRPGRDMRRYEYATPTIILINQTEIVVCNYRCSDYTEENFEYWKDTMLKYFGNDETMVIEVFCEGPLEWTRNAPDPKERRKMY